MIKQIDGKEYFSVGNIENLEMLQDAENKLTVFIDSLFKKNPSLFPILEEFKKNRKLDLKAFHIGGRIYTIGDMLYGAMGDDYRQVEEVIKEVNIVRQKVTLIQGRDNNSCSFIACDKEEYAEELISYLKAFRFCWMNGSPIKNGTYWKRFKESTHYTVLTSHQSVGYSIYRLWFYYNVNTNIENVIFCLR